MQTRDLDWYDVYEQKPKYGIQVFYKGRWLNAMKSGVPLLFSTKEERDARRKELKNAEAKQRCAR